jgi:hypothetical protein
MFNRKPDKEDYFTLATISAEGEKLRGVPCKIYLPKRVTESPRIVMHPSKSQYRKLSPRFEVALQAKIREPDGTLDIEVVASTVYLTRASTQYWGPVISESIIEGDPRDLRIIQFIQSTPDLLISRIVFWISPNKMLSPDITQEPSYTGEVTVNRVRQIEFQLREDIHLKFDKHFRSDTDEDNFWQWSDLIAESAIPYVPNNFEVLRGDVLPDLDDFLLLASLASRTRTACVGWNVIGGNTITDYYRRNIVVPTGYSLPSLDQGLISLVNFPEFLRVSHATFKKLTGKQAVRRAIYLVVPDRDRKFEEGYLSLFSGLEELILEYRRRIGFEYVVPPREWPDFQKEIKVEIRKLFKNRLKKKQQRWIEQKLSELNRIPLRVGFDQLARNLGVVIEDLWPVFSNNDGPGLYDIRNRLIHGESFPKEAFSALVVAKEHLEWTLERLLLAILEWPVENSEVSPSFLQRNATGMTMLLDARTKLKELLN